MSDEFFVGWARVPLRLVRFVAIVAIGLLTLSHAPLQ